MLYSSCYFSCLENCPMGKFLCPSCGPLRLFFQCFEAERSIPWLRQGKVTWKAGKPLLVWLWQMTYLCGQPLYLVRHRTLSHRGVGQSQTHNTYANPSRGIHDGLFSANLQLACSQTRTLLQPHSPRPAGSSDVAILTYT